METVSLNIGRLESLLIENPKFSKQWLKNLKRHQNDCPCKLNGYTNVSIADNNDKNKDKPCPFSLRQYGESCFSCNFAQILRRYNLKHYHLTFILKRVIKGDYCG